MIPLQLLTVGMCLKKVTKENPQSDGLIKIMISLNTIYNEDCFVTMNNMVGEDFKVDLILTSPPYNTNKKATKTNKLVNLRTMEVDSNSKPAHSGKKSQPYIRYDEFTDNITNEEYIDWTVRLFNLYNKVLKPNGVVVYNLSYGANNSEGMFQTVAEIIQQTNFTVVDTIIWKKKCATPNNMSSNRLTRICEFVFIFCRKSESKTFNCNKQVISLRSSGQKNYENIFNYIEAKNNDGNCPYNKATYSSELCLKLLNIYCKRDADVVVYDSFMGSGTTAVACREYGVNYIGSELSQRQCGFAEDRIRGITDGTTKQRIKNVGHNC